jgi:tetratricopeptide (TPR) repeat protein
VINLGMTATNSYTVADISRELMEYEPDLLCVYDGHNEFYGSLGIASHESISASRWLTKVYLRLVHFRTFVLLRDLYWSVQRLVGGPAVEQQSGTMMERLARGQYIRYGDAAYREAMQTFSANVAEVAERCRAGNVPVLFCAQVSNLRDQPPFVSEDSPLLAPEQRFAFHSSFNKGMEFLLNGDYPSVLDWFQAASRIDSLRADAHYRMAVCLDSLGRKHEALAEYVKARDYDMLRFRASSDCNSILRRLADDTTVFFVDVERKFQANSADELVGNNLILEHLHPNSRGYFLIAKEIAWTMHLHQLYSTREEWTKRNVDDEILWAERPLTELDERCATRRTELLTSGWPFRPDTRPLPPISPEDTLTLIADRMVAGAITWEEGHVSAAQFFERRGDWEKVEKEYRALINQIPLNVSAYLVLGQLYLRQGRNMDAARILLASTRVEQTFFANRALGTLALEPHDAIPFLERAVTLAPGEQETSEAGYLLAEAYFNNGEVGKARDRVQEVLRRSPGFTPAQRLLSRIAARHQ